MSAVLFPPSKGSLFTFIRTKQMVKLFSVTESSLYGINVFLNYKFATISGVTIYSNYLQAFKCLL
jgi:hypothetical protein